MQQFATAATTSSSSKATVKPIVAQLAGTIVLGLVILYGVGFAYTEVAHNAAHDTRHAFAFPCH